MSEYLSPGPIGRQKGNQNGPGAGPRLGHGPGPPGPCLCPLPGLGGIFNKITSLN